MPRFVPIRTSLSDDNDNYTQIRIVVKWQARYSRANAYLKKSTGYNSYFAGNKLCNNLKLLISRKFICACPVTRVLELESGNFLGHSSARGTKFRGVLASRASESQGGGSAQGNESDGVG